MLPMLDGYEIIGECAPSKPPNRGPNIIQGWVPLHLVDDPDPTKPKSKSKWCISLDGDKSVELRNGDRVVVLRPKEPRHD